MSMIYALVNMLRSFVHFTIYFEFLLSSLLKCLCVIKASTAEEFHEVIGTELFAFTLNTLDGRIQELCKDGTNITVK